MFEHGSLTTATGGAGAYQTALGIAIDWVVGRSSFQEERRLNVQSGHREVRRARPVKHQAMPREEGNTEKVGMVTCCQEPRGRRLWIIAAAGSQRRVLYWSVEAMELT